MWHHLTRIGQASVAWIYFWAFVGGAVGALSFLFILQVTSTQPFGHLFPGLKAVFVGGPFEPDSPAQHAELWNQINNGTIVTADNFLGAITGYYATVITILIGLFALFAFVSVLTIQRISRAQMEETVESNTAKFVDIYFKSAEFGRSVNTVATPVLRDLQAELQEELEGLDGALSDLGDRLAMLEARIAELDDEEEEPGAGRVEEP
jgi:hypothetical protein